MKILLYILRYPISVLGLHILLTLIGGYTYFDRLDNVMHFLGGASIALACIESLGLLEKIKRIQIPYKIIKVIVILGLVSLCAVLWELAEFGLDNIFHTKTQPNLTDTISDLALGLLGGLVIILINHDRKRL